MMVEAPAFMRRKEFFSAPEKAQLQSCALSLGSGNPGQRGHQRFLCIVNRMALEPVLIANRAHLLQGGAAHACRKFTSFPGKCGAESDRATYHAPRNRSWKAITTATHADLQKAGTGPDGSQT
jgi:hypothetical protein